MDTEEYKVIRIDLLPTGVDNTLSETKPYKIHSFNEYIPECHELRTDLKPLNVVQPEGASFKVTQTGETGEIVEWQKWHFRIGFNRREGMVLYDVSSIIRSTNVFLLTALGTIRWAKSVLSTVPF